MSASLSDLIAEMQPFARALVDAAGAAGLQPRVTSTLRTRAEQTRLYRRFLQGLQVLPVAKPGTSAHEFGYAMDLVVTPIGALTDVGALWESWGGVWGGEFKDPVHFEYPGFGAQTEQPTGPVPGDLFYKVADFLSGFVPWLGEVQLADSVFRIFGGDPTVAEFYLQHPAEAVRDILNYL